MWIIYFFIFSVFGFADQAGGSFGINLPRRLAAEGPRKAKKLISEQKAGLGRCRASDLLPNT